MYESVAHKLNVFFKKSTFLEASKGTVLIQAEQEPAGVFFLVTGVVKMYKISLNGEELVANLFKEGSFFPMSWAINNKLNEYNFECTTDCTLWRAPKDEVIEFIKSDPEILFDLLSRLYSGLDGFMERMMLLMGGSAYIRVCHEIVILARRFGKEFLKDNQFQVELSVLEKDIAMQTGLSRETVSREMKKIQDKGLVQFKNQVIIIPKLQDLVDEVHAYF